MVSMSFFRIYETGGEILLDELEQELADSHSISRSRFSRVKPKSISMGGFPLQISLGTFKLQGPDHDLLLSARAKIFDIGAISICITYQVPLDEEDSFEELALFFADHGTLDHFFTDYLTNVNNILQSYLGNLEIDPELYEDYSMYHTERPDQTPDPVTILMGEKTSFSPQFREEILKNTLSFTSDDFAIISWDSAVLCGREDQQDLMDLIEYANVQLLELRFYDNQLNLQMETMYDDIKNAESLFFLKRVALYRQIMNKLMEWIADITEVREKISNLIKVTEDIYYARVYEITLKVLRINQWTESINRKVSVIRESYSMLSNEVNIQHSNLLEWIIIALIALEFGLAIWQAIR